MKKKLLSLWLVFSVLVLLLCGATEILGQKIVADDNSDSDRFGYSTSISGDYTIIGAYWDDDNGVNSGSAYIFRRTATDWVQEAKLLADDGNDSNRFGYSVSISGDYAIVGARRDDDNGVNSGSAYIFRRTATDWVQEAKLLADDGETGDYFGSSVSIFGNYAIVGVFADDTNDNGVDSGSVYIFKKTVTGWVQEAKLLADDGETGDYFGISVSISNNYAIAGASRDNDNGISSGSAYIYDISSSFGEPLQVQYPNGGETFVKSHYYDIKWNKFGVNSNVNIDLFKGGVNILRLASNMPNTGSHPFNPMDSVADGNNYRIKVSSVDGLIHDMSDNYFMLVSEYGQLPDHFAFNAIGSQTINVPFTATVYAKDANGNTLADYNGIVNLSSNLGRVSPMMAHCVNGEATVNLKLFFGGEICLLARAYGISGESNAFAVSGGGSCVNGIIVGEVIDTSGTPVVNADVFLFNINGNIVRNVATSSTGYFSLTGLDCGSYRLKVEKGSHDYETTIDMRDDSMIRLPSVMLGTDAVSIYDTPVILIPGLPGSSLHNILLFPLLPFRDDPENSALRIFDPYVPFREGLFGERLTGFTDLRKALRDEGFMVIDCPWDWRLEMEDARKYLTYQIDRALLYSGTGKVHIVAHSMGGLLVRDLIQNTGYYEKIDKFVMVGTPNLGSPIPYYIWEGGDPKLADDVIDEGFPQIIVNAYSNTIQQMHMSTYGRLLWKNSWHKKIRKFVHEEAPSLLQLVSTEDFLFDGGVFKGTSENNENSWLKDLNGDSNINRMSRDGSGGTVQVGIFAGGGKSDAKNTTVAKIPVGDPNKLYEDGEPVSPATISAVRRKGDGTVPYESAVWPDIDGWADIIKKESKKEHSALIGVYKNDIVDFLKEDQTAMWKPALFNWGIASLEKINVFSLPLAYAEETINSVLSLSLNGPARAIITDPQGRKTGIASDNTLFEEIPGSELSFLTEHGAININDPVNGAYSVTLFGQGGKDFRTSIGYMDNEQTDDVKLRGPMGDNSQTFSISVQAGQEIQVIPEVAAPVGTSADLCGELTCLSWNASSGIDHFNVYAAKDTEPFFTKIASVSGDETSFATTDQWSRDASTSAVNYAISAVNGNGKESFFSEIVRNDDQDHDNINDIEEKIQGTSHLYADTDGDGLSDYDEQYRYGTDPLKIDTDEDGETDYIEIHGSQDPAPEFPWWESMPLVEPGNSHQTDLQRLIDYSDLGSFLKAKITLLKRGWPVDITGNTAPAELPWWNGMLLIEPESDHAIELQILMNHCEYGSELYEQIKALKP